MFYGRIATAGLRTDYFLVESGTLFRSLPTRGWRRRANVGPETSVFALPLCGASPFCWVPWRFRVLFALEATKCGSCDRDLHHHVENRCGLESCSCAGPHFWRVTNRCPSSLRCVAGFAGGRTHGCIFIQQHQEVTTLPQRQDCQTTPRYVSVGGGRDQDLCSGSTQGNCHRGASFPEAIDELAEHVAQLEQQHQVFVPEPRCVQHTSLRTREL